MKRLTVAAIALSIITLCSGVSTGQTYNWIELTQLGVHYWHEVASSADGMTLVVAGTNDYLYSSRDGGESWSRAMPQGMKNWMSVASTADGRTLYAVSDSVYKSTDAGVSWASVPSAPITASWQCIAVSADGSVVAAGDGGNGIFLSSDFGSNWVGCASPAGNWRNLAISADGKRIAAARYMSYVYSSTNSGSTWIERTSAGVRRWCDISCSADGVKLAAVATDEPGYIYTSNDAGVTWSAKTTAGVRYWGAITSSNDGMTLVAADYSTGYIYSSRDGGASWVAHTSPGNLQWTAAAVSADGSKILAGGGTVYQGLLAPDKPMLVSPADSNAGIACDTILIWRSTDRATRYNLQVSIDSSFASPVLDVDTVKNTAFPIGSLKHFTKYFWRVRAGNKGGWGDWSEYRVFTTVIDAPSLRTPVSDARDVSTNVVLEWGMSLGATSYQIQFGEDSTFQSSMIDAALDSLSYPISGLARRTTYYWRVRAENTDGSSDWTAWRSFVTLNLLSPILRLPNSLSKYHNPCVQW